MEMPQPQVLPIELQWAQAIVTLIVAGLVGLGGAIWTFARWYGRPSFVIGVPPTFTEQEHKGISKNDLGRRSVFNEFKHNPRCLARHIRRDKEALTESDLRGLYSDSRRCRTLELGPDDSVMLGVIVENRGHRAARDYLLAICILNPHIHIVDATTESLKLNTFYCNREDLVQNIKLRPYIANKGIVQAYDNYMDVGEQSGDMIYLKGELESGAYEMILLKIVRAESDTDRFVIRYHLDCSDGWISKQTYFQGFVIGQ